MLTLIGGADSFDVHHVVSLDQRDAARAVEGGPGARGVRVFLEGVLPRPLKEIAGDLLVFFFGLACS